jgi:hypothetical protein
MGCPFLAQAFKVQLHWYSDVLLIFMKLALVPSLKNNFIIVPLGKSAGFTDSAASAWPIPPHDFLVKRIDEGPCIVGVNS